MDEGTPDERLARLQRRQHGAFAVRQAVAVGVPASTVSMRFRRGRYRVLLPNVGTDHGTPDSWELRAMAAQLWAGGDAVLARGSAARLLGWDVPAVATRQVHLLTSVRTRDVPEGLVLHRSRSFDPAIDSRRDGPFTLTSPARTIVDLAGGVSSRQLRDVVAQAVRRGQADPGGISEALQRVGRVAGAGSVRGVLAALSPLHAACRSWLESAYVDLTAGTGLEPTAMNHLVRDARGDRRRIDAVYLPEHVPVELDGAMTHTSALDRADDADREDQIRLAGPWHPFVRLSYLDVTTDGDRCLARVEAALRSARGTGLCAGSSPGVNSGHTKRGRGPGVSGR